MQNKQKRNYRRYPKRKNNNEVKNLTKLVKNSLVLNQPPKTADNIGPLGARTVGRSFQGMKNNVRMAMLEHQLTIGDAGLRLIRCAVNPLGSGESGAWHNLAAQIPDAKTPSLPVTLSTSVTVTGAGPYLFQAIPPNYTNAAMMIGYSGGTHTDPASSPTGHVLYYPEQATDVLARLYITGTGSAEMRIVGCAMRIVATSSSQNTSGTLRGFLCKDTCHTTAGGTYQPYGHVTGRPVEESHSLNDGITIRCGIETTDYHDVPVGDYTWCINSPFTSLPAILVTGAVAATTIEVVCVMHVELTINAATSSIPPTISDVEPFLSSIVGFCNREVEYVVSGNTFKPLKALGKVITRSFRILKQQNLLLPIARSLIPF